MRPHFCQVSADVARSLAVFRSKTFSIAVQIDSKSEGLAKGDLRNDGRQWAVSLTDGRLVLDRHDFAGLRAVDVQAGKVEGTGDKGRLGH